MSTLMSAAYDAHCKRSRMQGFRPLGPLVFSVITMQLCYF